LPFSQFTLEHILPEQWKKEWKLPSANGYVTYEDLFTEEYKENDPSWTFMPSKDGLVDESYLEAFELANERNRLRQNIGNLSVVTGKLNSSLSNSTFSEKRESLYANSTLMLSKEICMHENWDVNEILEREKKIYTQFCELWPSARSFEENSA